MSSSKTEFGLPLAAPSKQTILPVVTLLNTTCTVHGFFAIPETTFTGTETSFQVQAGTGGSVPVQSVTLPTKINDGTGPVVSQYMAATWDQIDSEKLPWGGYTSFIPSIETGFYSRWSTPTGLRKHWYDPGSLLGSFMYGMDMYPTYVPPTVPPIPGEDGTLRWVVSLNVASIDPACTFFDFNWVTLFATSLPTVNEPGTNTVIPLEIITETNPPGGEFRAAILQRPEYVQGGGTMFNTIRILRMPVGTVEPGDYEFTFTIRATNQGIIQTTPVTLTLTVV